jgi:hypothetical protein
VWWHRRSASLLKEQRPLVVATGLAMWVTLVLLTARWPLHSPAVHWLLPLIPIYLMLRNQLVPPLRIPPALERRALVARSLALFPLACHWLVALKPEVSADGLAMHMVIPARVAATHAWTFDPTEFAWALMPMGGDWAWSIAWLLGGEAAARLLNVALLGLLAWMIFERLHARVPNWTAAALLGAFLSTPLVQLVTGSLFVENFVAVMITAAVLLARVHAKQRHLATFLAVGLICGVAMASKLGALAFVVPLLAATLLMARPKAWLAGVVLALAIGAVPYAEAWIRAGNPVFPFFNAEFCSPHFPRVNMRDGRFLTPLSSTTLYDATFHSSRFVEGRDGAAGFFCFLFVPLALVGWRRRWPKIGFVLLWVGLAGCVITWEGQSNLRYVYAALPLATLLGGVLIAGQRARSRALAGALGAAAAAAAVLNLAFLPAAGNYHRDFYTDRVLNPASVDAYLADHAPERRLVDYLNAHAPNARVAWLAGNVAADFRGRSYTNGWHGALFAAALAEAREPSDISKIVEDAKIQYFIGPTADRAERLTNVHILAFLLESTDSVLASSGVELRRWRTAPLPPLPLYAPPGDHDELNTYVTYSGPWIRDMQFTRAWRGTLVYTNNNTARVRIRFDGSAVRLRFTAAANRCQAQVMIDGGEPQPFNQYSLDTHWAVLSPPFRAAAPGHHEALLRFTPTDKMDAVGGCFIDLDGFRVE